MSFKQKKLIKKNRKIIHQSKRIATFIELHLMFSSNTITRNDKFSRIIYVQQLNRWNHSEKLEMKGLIGKRKKK